MSSKQKKKRAKAEARAKKVLDKSQTKLSRTESINQLIASSGGHEARKGTATTREKDREKDKKEKKKKKRRSGSTKKEDLAASAEYLTNSHDSSRPRSLSASQRSKSLREVRITTPEEQGGSADVSIAPQMHDNLDSNEIEDIAERMVGALDIKDRVLHRVLHKKCFVGCEAVKWLLDIGEVSSEGEAVALGNTMMKNDIFYNTQGQYGFENSDECFYRFTKDETNLIEEEFKELELEETIKQVRETGEKLMSIPVLEKKVISMSISLFIPSYFYLPMKIYLITIFR